MSVRVLSDVWNHSKATGGDLLVLLAIADFADDKGLAWPAVETIAKKARMTDRNVRKILRRLEKSGDLVVDHRKRNESNYYRVTLGPERQDWLFPVPANPVQSSARPVPADRVNGPVVPPDPVPEASQTVKEPSENRQKEDGVENALSKWGHDHATNLAFVERWHAYVDARKKRRKPVSAVAAPRLLGFLATLSLADAIASLDASIQNDWTGLFPPRGSGLGGKPERKASFA